MRLSLAKNKIWTVCWEALYWWGEVSKAIWQRDASQPHTCTSFEYQLRLGQGREYHLCRVAGNTVWSHMACEFPQRCGNFANCYTLVTYLLTCLYMYVTRIVYNGSAHFHGEIWSEPRGRLIQVRWAHASLPPKWNLDRFSRFRTARRCVYKHADHATCDVCMKWNVGLVRKVHETTTLVALPNICRF